jgi:hypothetical protein
MMPAAQDVNRRQVFITECIKQSSFCEHCGSIPLLRTINIFRFYAAAAALNIVFAGLTEKLDWLLINRKSD